MAAAARLRAATTLAAFNQRQDADQGVVISGAPKPSLSDLIAAYDRLGSVWLVAEEFGMTGQRVHRELRAAGIPTKKRWVSDEEKAAIERYYRNTSAEAFSLGELAASLGRTKPFVCRIAKSMGLTVPVRPLAIAVRDALRVPKWQDKPHPKGMAGKKHSTETLAILSACSKRTWATHKAFNIGLYSAENRQRLSDALVARAGTQPAAKSYHRGAAGVRPDIGPMYFRSRWEANYARYLNLLKSLGAIVDWDYEQETFWFEAIKRGVRSYKPDFRVWYKGEQEPVRVEVKGWLKDSDRTKWSRMRKYYPHIRLEIVGQKEYTALSRRWASSIPNWETQRGREVVLAAEAQQ